MKEADLAFQRSGGLLLHPTSLPGSGGIGTIGEEARHFVDVLAVARLGLWQILPLSPTGYGDSPYAALSAFAGNPLLIALEPLVEQGLLTEADLDALPRQSTQHVDFGQVVSSKWAVLRRAFSHVGSVDADPAAERFRAQHEHWLTDFALYMAIKDAHGGAPWNEWEPALRSRQPHALEEARARLQTDIQFHIWTQFIFFHQWEALKRYANERGIRIIGDIPIFVACDSADVWANQQLFRLTPGGTPEVVAGVPPDYFTATGQLWGNPHYRWDRLEAEDFKWWVDRFRMALTTLDIVRLDHFRGFAAAWAVPYGDRTAEHGQCEPSPGADLFASLKRNLGELAIVAEDLGVITPDVEELRDTFGFPGMQVLQFAFGGGSFSTMLPHDFLHNTAVYTGTHDNDTTVGWFSSRSDQERAFILAYVNSTGYDIAWDMIRLAFSTVGVLAVVPMQDVLRLGSSARMNLPGQVGGNWTWRYLPGDVTQEHVRNLQCLAKIYGRAVADTTV